MGTDFRLHFILKCVRRGGLHHSVKPVLNSVIIRGELNQQAIVYRHYLHHLAIRRDHTANSGDLDILNNAV